MDNPNSNLHSVDRNSKRDNLLIPPANKMLPSAELKNIQSFLFSLTGRQRTALVILFLSYLFYVFILANQDAPIVQTSEGLVRGIILPSRDGRDFFAYYGMKYAEQPVGNLRFQPPQPPKKFEGVWSASSYGSPCIQVDIISGFRGGEEACLFVNVFTPKMPQKGQSLLPVLFFIHGGLFMSGASDFYGPQYFMDEDVVLVTINYRLGVFGFLNTEDSQAKGNQGMKDQVMALKWVQRNIANFGGNPNQVTIFGESAGGASVHFLMLSPLARGLFHRAISQSGTANSPWLHSPNPSEQSKRFAGRVNCPTTKGSAEMVDCLKKLSAIELVEQHRELVTPPRDRLAIFAPSIERVVDDDTFLAADHMEIMKNGSFTSKVPWLLGLNAEEGLIFSAEIVRNSTMTHWARTKWETLGPVLLHYKPESSTSEAIKQYYFYNNTNPNGSFEDIDGYTKVHSDRAFFVPFHKSVQIHSKYQKMYLYFFNHRPQTSIVKFLLSLRGEYNIYVELAMTFFKGWVERTFYGGEIVKYGVCHADELQMLFDLLLMPSIGVGAQDYNVSKAVVKTWTQFAYDSTELSFGSKAWDAVNPNASSASLRYMQMTAEDSSSGMIDEPFTHRVKFWDSLSKLSSS